MASIVNPFACFAPTFAWLNVSQSVAALCFCTLCTLCTLSRACACASNHAGGNYFTSRAYETTLQTTKSVQSHCPPWLLVCFFGANTVQSLQTEV